MAEPLAVTDSDFKQAVLQSPNVVLVDFWAAWCGPCRALAPVIDGLAKEYGELMKFTKLNVDENSKTAAKYGIHSIPTLLLFYQGKVMKQVVGYHDKRELKGILDETLGQAKGSEDKKN